MPAILIVDDDPTIRAMFTRALQNLGEIESAGNGADALKLLGSKKFNVILLDLHMPVIDGFVILHTLATKAGPNRETPVYVVTADTSDQARVRALRRHAVFFLTKPVPIVTLVALVDSTLKKSAARVRTGSPPRGAESTMPPPRASETARPAPRLPAVNEATRSASQSMPAVPPPLRSASQTMPSVTAPQRSSHSTQSMPAVPEPSRTQSAAPITLPSRTSPRLDPDNKKG